MRTQCKYFLPKQSEEKEVAVYVNTNGSTSVLMGEVRYFNNLVLFKYKAIAKEQHFEGTVRKL